MKLSYWYALSVFLVVIDQATKWIANTQLQYHEPVYVLSWFNWMLTYNSGAAFSFLGDAGGWQRWFFVVLSSVISVVLVVWIRRAYRESPALALALSLVLGGAIGNLIDRAWLGYVIDFIQWHYKDYYWPTFNGADVFISLGAVLLIGISFLEGREEKKAQQK